MEASHAAGQAVEINILRPARRLTEEDRVYLVPGGTHPVGASPEQMTRTIEELKQLDVKWLGVSHLYRIEAGHSAGQRTWRAVFLQQRGHRDSAIRVRGK